MKIDKDEFTPSELWVGKATKEQLREWEKKEFKEKRDYGYKLEAAYVGNDGEEKVVETTFLGLSNNGSIEKAALMLIEKIERDLNVKILRHRAMPWNGGRK